MSKKTYPGMIVYFEDLEALEMLNDTQLGRLLRAMGQYSLGGGVELSDDPVVAMAFSMIRRKLDRDRAHYEQVSQARSLAARKHHSHQTEQLQHLQPTETVTEAVTETVAETETETAKGAETVTESESEGALNAPEELRPRSAPTRFAPPHVAPPRSAPLSPAEGQASPGEGHASPREGRASTGKARKRFTPPERDSVRAYAEQMGYDGFNADAFVDFYAAKGWLVGRNSMKDWRAAVRNWHNRDKAARAEKVYRGDFDPARDW